MAIESGAWPFRQVIEKAEAGNGGKFLSQSPAVRECAEPYDLLWTSVWAPDDAKAEGAANDSRLAQALNDQCGTTRDLTVKIRVSRKRGSGDKPGKTGIPNNHAQRLYR